MYDDPIGALEAELIAAARRRTGRGRARWRPAFGSALTAAAAGVALIVAVGTVVLLGRHDGGQRSGVRVRTTHSVTQTATATSLSLALEPIVRALIGTVPDGQAGLHKSESVLQQLGFGAYPRATFTAGAVTAPGRVRIELWEVAVQPQHRAKIDVLAAVIAGRVVARATASLVRTHGLAVPLGHASVAVIVPNDVRRVRFRSPEVVPQQAVVRRNLVAFHVTGFKPVTLTDATRMIWYGRGGDVLRRVGPAH